jgi:5-methylcytosine-specific restriction endonuclease McrA
LIFKIKGDASMNIIKSIINHNTNIGIDALKLHSKKTIVTITKTQLMNNDFKEDTFQLLYLLLNFRENRGFEYLLGLVASLKSKQLPSIHQDVNISEKLTNAIYHESLSIYYKKGKPIPTSSEEYILERLHAVNTYSLLSSMPNYDNIKYGQHSSNSKNILVKAILSHQNKCFCCGRILDGENSTIDHLVPSSHQQYNHIIEPNDINKICNLGKMCDKCNNNKADKLLITFHYESNGFKFYPLNVLYLLYAQQKSLILDKNTEEFDIIQLKFKDYKKKYNIKSVVNLEEKINTILNGDFPEIGKRSMLRFFSFLF